MNGEHLPGERILELALDELNRPGNGEARHLAGCAACTALLEEERELTARLREIAPTGIPPGFGKRATARFAEAVRARTCWHLAPALALLAGIGAVIAALLSQVWLQAIGSAAAVAGGLAALVKTAWIIVGSAPAASIAFAALMCAVGLAGCWSLARLARDRSAVKYPARPVVHPSGNAR